MHVHVQMYNNNILSITRAFSREAAVCIVEGHKGYPRHIGVEIEIITMIILFGDCLLTPCGLVEREKGTKQNLMLLLRDVLRQRQLVRLVSLNIVKPVVVSCM